jgi:catechol-2,3-dioxygenase
MLGDHLVFPILRSPDLGRARAFYHGTLGLELLIEEPERLVLRCGAGSLLTITRSATASTDRRTRLGWRVPDLRAELQDLRARGVRIEEYEAPDPATTDGVADMGFAWAAWIIDPDGNTLAIVQDKSGPDPAR